MQYPAYFIYSSRVTRKERNRVGTKFSEGQLFIFRDRQDSCLPSAARLDSPGDQGKGKVGPRKILFLQDYSFFSGNPRGHIFSLNRGLFNHAI